MVSAMDDGLGRVLKTLKERNIEENTIVVFLSDNGGPVHKNASKNDQKWSLEHGPPKKQTKV